MEYSIWQMVHGVLYLMYGMWFSVYDIRLIGRTANTCYTVYGVRYISCGILDTVYGMRILVVPQIYIGCTANIPQNGIWFIPQRTM